MTLWVEGRLKRAGYGKRDEQEAETMVKARVEEGPAKEGLVGMH